jgi:hypothetical protein
MKHISFLFLVAFQLSAFSQNKSWQYYQDTIQPLLNSNKYSEAKQKFIALKKSDNIDPDYKLFFIQYSLMYDDTSFYKSEVKQLMSKHGLQIDYADSLLIDERYNVLNYLKSEKLKKWSVNKSTTKYGIWSFKNQRSIKIKEAIKLAKERDQLVRTITFSFYPKIQRYDSLCFNNVYLAYKNEIADVDTKNCHLVEELCKLNGNYLPNNFDNGIGTFNSISLFISHNLKQGTNIEYLRTKIFPYIEQAFLDRKIDMDLFYIYDIYLNKYFGYQYYGTLSENVPVLEKETFAERKSRLKF